ncbi:MAG: hypothetical protein LBT65_07360 [Synergistaceae bacterium]|jgi:hypothetical protein|nr:hypothetical protein [Synergistaceae bacterium]
MIGAVDRLPFHREVFYCVAFVLSLKYEAPGMSFELKKAPGVLLCGVDGGAASRCARGRTGEIVDDGV